MTNPFPADSLERYARLHEFIAARIREDIYPEPVSDLHQMVTREGVKFIDQLFPLAGKRVLDAGCGQGLALREFRALGAHPVGLTFGEDFRACRAEGFEVYEMDQSFLDFPADSFDLVWSRHALEHSLFPYFTLHGFFQVLKPGGLLYLEVPAPDTSAHHETNRNHYSCLTASGWRSLAARTGFELVRHADIHLKLVCGDDIYYRFVLKKPEAR